MRRALLASLLLSLTLCLPASSWAASGDKYTVHAAKLSGKGLFLDKTPPTKQATKVKLTSRDFVNRLRDVAPGSTVPKNWILVALVQCTPGFGSGYFAVWDKQAGAPVVGPTMLQIGVGLGFPTTDKRIANFPVSSVGQLGAVALVHSGGSLEMIASLAGKVAEPPAKLTELAGEDFCLASAKTIQGFGFEEPVSQVTLTLYEKLKITLGKPFADWVEP